MSTVFRNRTYCVLVRMKKGKKEKRQENRGKRARAKTRKNNRKEGYGKATAVKSRSEINNMY